MSPIATLATKFDQLVDAGQITQGVSLDAGWAYNHWDGPAWLDLQVEAEAALSPEDFDDWTAYTDERLSEDDDGRAGEYNDEHNLA